MAMNFDDQNESSSFVERSTILSLAIFSYE